MRQPLPEFEGPENEEFILIYRNLLIFSLCILILSFQFVFLDFLSEARRQSQLSEWKMGAQT